MVFYPDTVDTTVQNVLECIRINIQNHSSDNRNVALWKAKLVIVLLYKLLPNKMILQPLHRYFFYVYWYAKYFIKCIGNGYTLDQLLSVSAFAVMYNTINVTMDSNTVDHV